MRIDSITTENLMQLQQALALVDLASEYRADDPDRLRFLIARFNHIKVQMYRERGPHKRPHFHIEFKREYRASYTIDTVERIVGYMPKRYEGPILEWARSMHTQLAVSWDRIAAGGEPIHLEVEVPKPS